MPALIQVNESNALRRRVFFDIRGTDGISPVNSEDGEQPQVSVSGTDIWTNVGIGALTFVGFGRYFAILDQATLASVGVRISTRYKGSLTVETPGDDVQVVGFDPAEPLNVSGDGTSSMSFTIEDVNNNPIQFASAWVTTDEAGSNIIAGVLTTNADGQVTFQLYPGNYYLWRQHPNYNIINPQYFTVT